MVREPDDDPWARPRVEGPDRLEHLEGGDETTLAEHLRRPVVLGALAAAAVLAAAALIVAHPWQGAPAASPAPTTSLPPIEVDVVSTGSTGTVLPVEEEGWGAARMELRVDLVRGDGGRVLGIAGPGVSRSIAIGPRLEAGASSITLAGAQFRCPQVVGTAPSDFGLSVEVLVGDEATRIVHPLSGPDAATWLSLVQQACGFRRGG